MPGRQRFLPPMFLAAILPWAVSVAVPPAAALSPAATARLLASVSIGSPLLSRSPEVGESDVLVRVEILSEGAGGETKVTVIDVPVSKGALGSAACPACGASAGPLHAHGNPVFSRDGGLRDLATALVYRTFLRPLLSLYLSLR